MYTPKNVAQCPAEKMLRARNGIRSKAMGTLRNGHFYFPIEALEGQKGLKNGQEVSRPLSDGQLPRGKVLEMGREVSRRHGGQENPRLDAHKSVEGPFPRGQIQQSRHESLLRHQKDQPAPFGGRAQQSRQKHPSKGLNHR